MPSEDLNNAIAIVGLSGRFPGAKNAAQFWENQRNGVESISRFSADELEVANASALTKDSRYISARPILDDVDLFDAAFFGIYPKEAALMDPQHRVFLECCWEAIEDAGYDPLNIAGLTGVYAGCSPSTYFLRNVCSDPGFIQDYVGGYQVSHYPELLGSNADFLATRVSYKLNLKGPAFTLLAGCSTSLVAVCQACQGIQTYQCDLALAGGVSITFPQKRGYLYQEGAMVSPDGHCRAFDEQANGTIFGSGAGVVLLKRLEDAVKDGDHIYAVIRGYAVNNDGAGKVGYTAPSVEGQANVIAMAQAAAGVSAESIGYIEAHGTGTPLGDPIEVAALTQAFRAGTSARQFCALGTAKANVGHLDIAAGITGLIHAVHVLRYKNLPPTLHFRRPNPKLNLEDSPFYLNKQLQEWKSGNVPRRAGVSAFGVGGTNAHVVLEEAPAGDASQTRRALQLLVLSARSPAALDQAASNLAAYLKTGKDVGLSDIACTLQTGRRPFPHRRIVVALDREQAVSQLEAAEGRNSGLAKAEPPAVVFMFPGQGAQYCQMGFQLYESEPEYRKWVDECASILKPVLGRDLREVMYPAQAGAEEAQRLLTSTAFAQPALFTTEFALAKLWMSWGVNPEAMIGHSIGEFVAACLSGVFSPADTLRLVAARGRMMQQQPAGTMLAVRAPEAEVRTMLGAGVSIAAINSPALCVVSGPAREVEELEKALTARGTFTRRLHTSHAFHSPMMDPVVGPFAEVVGQAKLRASSIRYISGVTGTWATAEESTSPSHWGRHLREAVRFADGLQTLSALPNAALLEVGPGNTLGTLALQHPTRKSDQVVISSLPDASRKSSDHEAMLSALGRLWLAGVQPDWIGFHEGERLHRVSLPTYPFERKRFWIDPKTIAGGGEERLELAAQAADEPEELGAIQAVAESSPETSTGSQPQDSVRQKLVSILGHLSGMNARDLDPAATFLELGFDSLFLTQFSQEVEKQLAVSVTFRQLMDQESSIHALAAYIGAKLPAESLPSKPSAPRPVRALEAALKFAPSAASMGLPVATPSSSIVESVMKEQLRAMLELMSRQLEAVRNLNLGTASAEQIASTFQQTIAELHAAVAVPVVAKPPASIATAALAVPSAPVEEAPLTEAQMELLLATQMDDQISCAFNEALSISLAGPLDEEALRSAIAALLDRHDALRMRLTPAGDRQRFRETEGDLPLLDLTTLDAPQQERRLLALKDAEARTPFDLVNGPPVRCKLVRLEADRHILLLTAHHMACDGWSTNIVLDELGNLYSSKRTGEVCELAPALSFGAYAHWQKQESQRPEAQTCQRWWIDQFSNLPDDLDLPADRPRAAVKTFHGSTYNTAISHQLAHAVKAASARRGCTLFVTLLSAFEVLLARLGQQNDLVIGVPVAGQSSLQGQTLVGHCVNFLPLRAQLSEGMKFSELLMQQKRRLIDAHEHRDFTYGTLLRNLPLRRALDRFPLTEVRFNLQRVTPKVSFAGLQAEVREDPKAFVNFPLVLNVAETDEGIELHCDYNTDLWDEATIARWLRHYETLLAGFVEDAEQTVQSMPLLNENDKRTILTQWNATETEYPRDRCMHQLFESQAERTPSAVAAIFDDQRLTYAELNQKANQLAHHLLKIGGGPGAIAGIYMERSLEMMVALLGILKSGAAYLPLDPSYPKERIDFIVAEANVPVLLTQSHLAVTLPRTTARVVCLDSDWELFARESGANLASQATPESLAYVIYTSGSTGKPKGVEIPHRAAVNLLCSMARTPGMDAADTMLAVTTLSFDIAALELFLPLCVGAKVVIASREVAADPVELMARMDGCGATIMQATPVTWRMLLEAGWTGRPLRKILCGGEALPRELADRLLALGPEIWNMYGPTETTIWSSTCRVQPGQGRVPIGPPIANTQFYILGPQNQPVPIGVSGELCIAGDGVARGYHKRPELTQERFVSNPFRPGERMYRTGDRARYLADGSIDFLGRFDHQVKLRGFRIELEEIESVLGKHPELRQAVCMVREDIPGDQRLVAYMVSKDGSIPSTAELRAFVGQKLPEYMIPSFFMPLSVLPLTANGKTDRKALPKPGLREPFGAKEIATPGSSEEKLLAQIWRDVLKIDDIKLHDSILDLGADSLQIFQITARANDAGLRLTAKQLVQSKTIAKLSAVSQAPQTVPVRKKKIRRVDREAYRVTVN